MISAKEARDNVNNWPEKLAKLTLTDINYMVNNESRLGKTEIITYLDPLAVPFVKARLKELGYEIQETSPWSMQYKISWE